MWGDGVGSTAPFIEKFVEEASRESEMKWRADEELRAEFGMRLATTYKTFTKIFVSWLFGFRHRKPSAELLMHTSRLVVLLSRSFRQR